MERPFTGRRREEEPPRRFGREGRAHWRLRRWDGEDCRRRGRVCGGVTYLSGARRATCYAPRLIDARHNGLGEAPPR